MSQAARRVFLLNDTEDVYHWGCYGTSRAIKDQLSGKGLTISDCMPVTQTHALPDVPDKLADLKDRKRFCSAYPELADKLDACDAVVINGEGTIHGFGSAPRALLCLAYAAKNFFGKRVFLINHSCYPQSRRAGVTSYYRAAYSSCDYVAARESRSALIIENLLGTECVRAFDSLPLAIRSAHDQVPAPLVEGPYICLSGAVNYRVARSPVIARRLRSAFPNHGCVYLVGSRKDGVNKEEPRVYESLRKVVPDLQLFEAMSFTDWLSVIKHADLLLSGRFHYAIAGLCLGTPTVCYRSNTPKISGMLEDLHLPGVVRRSPSFVFEFLLWYRLKQLRNGRNRRSFLDHCCSLAQRNFDWDI